MPDPNVTMPRARLEAMARQCLALREQCDALATLIQSELMQSAPTDPRTAKDTPPATFRRKTA